MRATGGAEAARSERGVCEKTARTISEEMPALDFDFYASGLEDGILEVLKTEMAGMGVKEFLTYAGQLDDGAAVMDAIGKGHFKPPCVLVAYAGGEDARHPATPPVIGRPLHYLHSCQFGIVVVDNDPRGEKVRRGRCYKMIGRAVMALTGRRLKTVVEGDEVLLNTQVFEPTDTIVLARLPNLTALGVAMDTAFKWSSPDRTAAGTPVEDLLVGVESLNQKPIGDGSGDPPGVRFEVES